MKKYLILLAFLFMMKHSFGQACVTTYSTVNITVGCHSFPYSYGNNSYFYPGEYTATLVNSNGCDSIVTLYLNLPPVGTSTTNVTICATQLPYSWGLETDIFTGGTYDNYINIYGCSPDYYDDSDAILNLTVLPADTVVMYDTLCYYQIPFNWFGQEIYGDGTYTGAVPNSGHGKCGTIGVLHATVIGQPESTTNLTICSSQLPYSWNGQSLTAGGYYSATIVTPNPNDCDSLADLNLTVNNNPASVTNVAICADKGPYIWNGKSYSTTGIDTAIIAHTGCDSLAILNLTVNPLSTITSFVPTTGAMGQAVVITGTNFTGASSVSFGGVPASSFTVIAPTTIIAIVASAASGAITVKTGCDTASLAGFTYNSMPGNIGIGTGAATSKLTVNGGDIQVADIGSGLILKSPDGRCWRLSMGNNGGYNGLQITLVPCP